MVIFFFLNFSSMSLQTLLKNFTAPQVSDWFPSHSDIPESKVFFKGKIISSQCVWEQWPGKESDAVPLDCYSLIHAVTVIMSECVLFWDKKAESVSECSLLTLRSLFTFCVIYFPHISGHAGF